jgi:hypothetical protein
VTADETDSPPRKGDQYVHDDGTTEVVFFTEDGRVLTFREYPSFDAFRDGVATAAYKGINDDVASLPGPAAFADFDPDVETEERE